MWEFSVSMHSEHIQIANFIFSSLKKVVADVNGVITLFEKSNRVSVVFACEEIEKGKLQYYIADSISKAICLHFKEKYLDKKLKIMNKNDIEIFTFKKALVCFDRETDRYIINKHLSLENNIVLESFFYFKLQAIQEKWEELVKIANDNSTYLLSNDSFLELLRFLIDNIEISVDELNVEVNDSCFKVTDANLNVVGNKSKYSEKEFVDLILSLSPRQINWLSPKKNCFLEKVFAKRIVYKCVNNNSKDNFFETFGLQN